MNIDHIDLAVFIQRASEVATLFGQWNDSVASINRAHHSNVDKHLKDAQADCLAEARRLKIGNAKSFEGDFQRWDVVLQLLNAVENAYPRHTWGSGRNPVAEALRKLAIGRLRADTCADTKPKKFRRAPRNIEVYRLMKKLDRENATGRTQVDIAMEFTEGNEKKAASLLRGVRRFRRAIS